MQIADNIEHWALIDGYDNYEISSFGRVRNNITSKIMKQYIRYGYLSVGLNKDGKGEKLYIHRLVAFAFIPNPENKLCVDHIDCNKENNHISNLRWATYQENSMNSQKTTKTTLSKYKGVSFDKRYNKWRARLTFNNKTIHIGYYDNEEDAAKAYDVKASELFGQYAKLNF